MFEPDGDANLLVFDVDGTLVDSKRTIHEAARRASQDVLDRDPAIELVLPLVGLPLDEVLARLHPDANTTQHRELVDRYRHHFALLRADASWEPPLYPGTVELLDRLLARGHSLAIATGKSRRGLEHTLDAHALRGFFETTRTGDDAPGKPHPGMLLDILDELDRSPHEALMIGDTTFDLDMATNARVRGVGVSWGYHDEEALLASKPIALLRSWPELERVIFELRTPR